MLSRRKSIGVFGCAYSITISVRVSRTRQAPANTVAYFRIHLFGSATFYESTLSRDSDEKNNHASARPIRCVGVLAAGTMGHGIAQVAATAGYAAVLRDVNTEALACGVQSIWD